MRQTRELIEAKGYDVIYGDTDSTFVWLRQPHTEEDAVQIGNTLAGHVNAWWKAHLRERYGLDSALELQFERHYSRFLMPTVRGTMIGHVSLNALRMASGGQAGITFGSPASISARLCGM